MSGKNKYMITGLIFILVILFMPQLVLAQTTTNSKSPLILDGAASTSTLKLGDEVQVNLSLIPSDQVCEEVVTRRPMDVILVIDRSSSMNEILGTDAQTTKLDGAITAVQAFIQLLQPEDRVGLVVYANKAARLSDLIQPVQAGSVVSRVKKISSATIGGNTNIESGIQESQSVFNSGHLEANHAIILLSDGKDSGSDVFNAAEKAKAAKIRMVTIGLGPEVDETLLRSVATNTSDYHYSPDASSLVNVYENIVKSIQTFETASNIEVVYSYDASNMDLVSGSVHPSAEILVNQITWKFDRISDIHPISLRLKPHLPGEYKAALRLELRYKNCGQKVNRWSENNLYPITVTKDGKTTMNGIQNCSANANGAAGNLITFLCGGSVPWGLIIGLILGLILMYLWMREFASDLRSWRRCGLPMSWCAWTRLLFLISLAILAGLLGNTLVHSLCAPSRGLLFWRIENDKSSAIYLKPTSPDLPVRRLTNQVDERQCEGCHTASSANQSFATISKGISGPLHVFDFDGVQKTIPAVEGSYPAWSPDGKKVAYAANNQDIYIHDVETGADKPLLGASDPGMVESMPAWSSDGSKIAFVRASGKEQNITITVPCDILTVPSSGGNPVLVPGASGVGFNYHPAFSPDGKWLAFTHHETGSTTYGDVKAEINIVPAEGGVARRITANDDSGGQLITDPGNTWPTWSLDSSTLYFSSRRCDNQYDIFSANITPDGYSSIASRVDSISSLQAFEYGVNEIRLRSHSILADLLDLWPWLILSILLFLLNYFICRPKKKKKSPHSIEVSIEAEPKDGWRTAEQKFNVQIEMLGKPVSERRAVRKSVDAVLLIDCSGSMAEMDMGWPALLGIFPITRVLMILSFIPHLGFMSRLAAARTAAVRFVRCLMGPRERVGLVSFSDNAFPLQSLTSDEKMIVPKIKSLLPQGGTSMHTGLLEATNMLVSQGRPKASRVIILLTDGEPTDPPELVLQAAEDARKAGIRILIVGMKDANARFLSQVAGDPEDFHYVNDSAGLTEAFMQAGRILMAPVAATEVIFEHHYNTDEFVLDTGSILPQPEQFAPGTIAWSIPELASKPLYFSYKVSLKRTTLNPSDIPADITKMVKSEFIDRPSLVTYNRGGLGENMTLSIAPEAKVNIRELPIPVDITLPEIPDPLKIELPEAVWQPDHALFIGIGGAGRRILTHVYKNLLDAGSGILPKGIRFLLIDTDEYEKLDNQPGSYEFAGIGIPPEDVFVLDENFENVIKAWAKDGLPAEFLTWLDTNDINPNLGQQLNLGTGTYGRRPIPRAALLRSLGNENGNTSVWQQKQAKLQKSADLLKWLAERCADVNRENTVRIFVTGSMAGGMNGITIDMAMLARSVAMEVVKNEAGDVKVEGYLADAGIYQRIPGDPNKTRSANGFASWRELSRWQLNPGYNFNPLWRGNLQGTTFNKAPFDDLLIFSPRDQQIITGDNGAIKTLDFVVYPSIADMISLRLDRATGAADNTLDWINQMRIQRTTQQRNHRVMMVGGAGTYTIRIPVYDIVRSLAAQWSLDLFRTFLAGEGGRDVSFDYRLANDPGFSADPGAMVSRFLIGGNLGGDSSASSRALGEILYKNSHNVGELDLEKDLQKPAGEVRTEFQKRLGEAINLIVFGSAYAGKTGSRAGRIAYAILFLAQIKEQLERLAGGFNQNDPLGERAKLFANETQLLHDSLLELRGLIKRNDNQSTREGLLETLESQANRIDRSREDLDEMPNRKYLWGIQTGGLGAQSNVKLFTDIWKEKYLAGQTGKYLDYLALSLVDNKMDLMIRVDDAPVCLRRDGIDKVVECLEKIAQMLLRDVYNNVTLIETVQSHHLFDNDTDGNLYGQRSLPLLPLSIGTQGQAGMIGGDRCFILAQESALSLFNPGRPFWEGLRQGTLVDQIAVPEVGKIKSTDRFAIAIMHLRDSVPASMLADYARQKNAYDTEDGYNIITRAFDNVAITQRAVFQPEAVARDIEKKKWFLYGSRAGGKEIHPLIVAAFQDRERCRLFCLALAMRWVKDGTDNTVLVTAGNQSITLIEQYRSDVNQWVDALLKWIYAPPPSWQFIESVWKSSLENDVTVNSTLQKWVNQPQPPLCVGGSDVISLGTLVSAFAHEELLKRNP